MTESTKPDSHITSVVVMIDTESLGLKPDSIVREMAFVAVDADDPDTTIKEVVEYLPLLPQEGLGRKVYVDTVAWLLDAPDEVKATIRDNINGDLDELCSIIRSFIRKFNAVTQNRAYEVWFRRPQHDVPMMDSLFTMCGEALPWRYDSVNDLATLMNAAELKSSMVGSTATPHIAINDCRFQMACFIESERRLQRVGGENDPEPQPVSMIRRLSSPLKGLGHPKLPIDEPSAS